MGLTLRREIISSMDRRFGYSFCSYPLMLIQIEIWNIYIYIYIHLWKIVPIDYIFGEEGRLIRR